MKIYDCIFLDRDGTINSDHEGYIKSLQNFKVLKLLFGPDIENAVYSTVTFDSW